jgi:hypothetical protein
VAGTEHVVGHCFLFAAVNQATNEIVRNYIIALDGNRLTARLVNQPIIRGHKGGGIGLDAQPGGGASKA